MSWWKILLIAIGVLALGGGGTAWYVLTQVEFDIYVPMYVDNCGSCHGDELQGTSNGPALTGERLAGGDSVIELIASIRNRHPQLGTPAFADVLRDVEIKGLAIFIGEQRLGQRFVEMQFDREVVVPAETLSGEVHDFAVETFATGLDPLIFSIEPMPDGRWLVSEKEKGLTIVSASGERRKTISGTPETGGSIDIIGVQFGTGWLLDVALHPDYENNGWVYLHYTHLCGEPCGDGVMGASMNRLDRGRIIDGQWTDVETIWKAPLEFYEPTPDTGAGGRIAFDDSGHVYIAAGIKRGPEGPGGSIDPQLLDNPYGKIHRIKDDGSIPLDNPFVVESDEPALQSIWTYGHRSPQGLEWHAQRGRIWNSEMGPRGGDEINELLPGENYGWPFFSQGLEYEGVQVARHEPKSIEFDMSEIRQSLVDITPSPAISSFVFYSGDRFPGWQGNVLIGSLKGSSLFRMVFEGDKFMHRETLVKDLARIRDIEVGFDGLVYLLLENEAGSQIVRLMPQV